MLMRHTNIVVRFVWGLWVLHEGCVVCTGLCDHVVKDMDTSQFLQPAARLKGTRRQSGRAAVTATR